MAKKKPKNSFFKDSAKNEEELEKDIPKIEYTKEEEAYLKNIQTRLKDARDVREEGHKEFDNLTYQQYYQSNVDIANTYLKPKKNRADTNFQSGTIRTKLMALLSQLQSLNLEHDINAYDRNNIPVQGAGDGMEILIDKTEEDGLDDELKMLRQYELLVQGDVFVEERWVEDWQILKDIKRDYDGSSAEWDEKKEIKEGTPSRTIISGLSVYLGDIRKYSMDKQPYIFTVTLENYIDLEKEFGNCDKWKYVKKGASNSSDIIDGNWSLSANIKKNQVEKIVYQDKPNNEYQVYLNGVPMFPIGYPLSAVSGDGDYTIIHQILDPIRHDFAYGKSFVFKNKNLSAVLDRMLELAVLKTHKSYMPPYMNLSQRFVSKDVFMPGKVSRGFQKGDLLPISEHEIKGVTNSEFAMIQEVKNFIDQNTVSQTFSGQKETGGTPTATQIMVLQKQSKMMAALTIISASLLEKKLTERRIVLLLRHWTNPIDTRVNKAKDVIENIYRTVSVNREVRGKKNGIKMVKMTENMPSPKLIRATEEDFEEKYGMPAQIVYMNPKKLQSISLIWRVTIIPKDKKSTEMERFLFGEMLSTAPNLAAFGLQFNPDWLAERFAQLWGESREKMFIKTPQNVPQSTQTPQGVSNPSQPTNVRLNPQLRVTKDEQTRTEQ